MEAMPPDQWAAGFAAACALAVVPYVFTRSLSFISGRSESENSDAIIKAIYGNTSPPTPDTHVKCPDCRELVLMDAKKCKHCGAMLTPIPPKANAAATASY